MKWDIYAWIIFYRFKINNKLELFNGEKEKLRSAKNKTSEAGYQIFGDGNVPAKPGFCNFADVRLPGNRMHIHTLIALIMLPRQIKITGFLYFRSCCELQVEGESYFYK